MNNETKKIINELEGSDPDKLELEELRREKSLKTNLENELKTLKELFPDLSAEDIPDEVFEGCEAGKGLAAQYALYYIRNSKEKEEREKTNEENTRSAPPEVVNAEDEVFFTPDAVKAMSEKDIRRHYKDIMKSMEKWK